MNTLPRSRIHSSGRFWTYNPLWIAIAGLSLPSVTLLAGDQDPHTLGLNPRPYTEVEASLRIKNKVFTILCTGENLECQGNLPPNGAVRVGKLHRSAHREGNRLVITQDTAAREQKDHGEDIQI